MSKLPRRNFLISASTGFLFGCLPQDKWVNIRGNFKKSYTPSTSKASMSGAKVSLTVGHGYHDAGVFDQGASSNGVTEFDLNLSQGDSIARWLSEHGAHVDLYVYREKRHGVSLEKRGLYMDGYDIHISLHHNSYHDSSVQGGEVLVCSNTASTEDKILAGHISTKMNNETGLKNRGVKKQGLAVLKSTPEGVVKCLTEPLFLTAKGLSGKETISLSKKAALGISKGVETYWLSRHIDKEVKISLAQNSGELKAIELKTIEDKGVLFSNLNRDIPEILDNELAGLYDDH